MGDKLSLMEELDRSDNCTSAGVTERSTVEFTVMLHRLLHHPVYVLFLPLVDKLKKKGKLKKEAFSHCKPVVKNNVCNLSVLELETQFQTTFTRRHEV